MIRYEKQGFTFYGSSDLCNWTFLSRINGFYECPDICYLPVDGNKADRKWVLIDGDGSYFIGTFDGRTFRPETARLRVSYGRLYATQTWKHTFDGDGPIIQMGFVGYQSEPQLTWAGQMAFPCRLTLCSYSNVTRLKRYPVDVVKHLYSERYVWKDLMVHPGTNVLAGIQGDIFDIHVEIELAQASAFGFIIRGERILYHRDQRILLWRESASLDPMDDRIRLRILVDRSSLEIFGNDGAMSMTDLFFASASDRQFELFVQGGGLRIVSLEVNRLESVWKMRDSSLGFLSAP